MGAETVQLALERSRLFGHESHAANTREEQSTRPRLGMPVRIRPAPAFNGPCGVESRHAAPKLCKRPAVTREASQGRPQMGKAEPE